MSKQTYIKQLAIIHYDEIKRPFLENGKYSFETIGGNEFVYFSYNQNEAFYYEKSSRVNGIVNYYQKLVLPPAGDEQLLTIYENMTHACKLLAVFKEANGNIHSIGFSLYSCVIRSNGLKAKQDSLILGNAMIITCNSNDGALPAVMPQKIPV